MQKTQSSSSNNRYLVGQLIPSKGNERINTPYTKQQIETIKNALKRARTNVVKLFVSSQNKLKTESATNALKHFLDQIFSGEPEKFLVECVGIECESNVGEQPHGIVMTLEGALNRLFGLEKKVLSLIDSTNNQVSVDPILHDRNGHQIKKRQRITILPQNVVCLISMENGVILEELNGGISNEKVFQVEKTTLTKITCWVDRCQVAVTFILPDDTKLSALAQSEGVTTPVKAVNQSEETRWTKTAGSFIAMEYGWDAKDWHASIVGKPRKVIMEEAIKKAFLGNYETPILIDEDVPMSSTSTSTTSNTFNVPTVYNEFKPDVFHQYTPAQTVEFFTPVAVEKLVNSEIQNLQDQQSAEDRETWRSFYATIPQSTKPGADEKNPQNCLGVILTEDLLVGYFDTVNGEDVLHYILTRSKVTEESKEVGWALPGKRDRAYAIKDPDISILDANCQLVEKEIKVPRTEIAYNFVLAFFDDRLREQRMKTSGFVSLVILKQKPVQFAKNLIGIPFSLLKALVKRQIKIPHDTSAQGELFGLVRNHDSLLLNIFDTNRFHTIMTNLQITRAKWRTSRNPLIPPPFPTFDPGNTCVICADLMIDSKIVCINDHTLCGMCAKTPTMFANGCPVCRGNVRNPHIKNLQLDQVIFNNYPAEYTKRHNEMSTAPLPIFENQSMFRGQIVQFGSE